MTQVVKPTFGATINTSDVQQEPRKELGAIWTRISSKSNDQFFSIKMKLTKDLIKRLSESTDEEVSLDLVAFPNKFKENHNARPDYRIYEEKKR